MTTHPRQAVFLHADPGRRICGLMVGEASRKRWGSALTVAVLSAGLAVPRGASAEPAPLAVAACTAPSRSLPAQTESAMAATLLLRSRHGVGSGVLVSPDGFALTAAHVVSGAGPLEATTFGGERVAAERVRTDSTHDLALIKLDVPPDRATSCLPLSETTPPIGAEIYVLGSPAGEALSFSVSRGIVSGHRRFASQPFVQLDASVNPGNSGGPVLDTAGRIVGIASWKVADVHFEGLSFAVPAAVLRDGLGLRFAPATDPQWRAAIEPDAHAPVDTAGARGEVSAPVRRRLRIRQGLLLGGGIVAGTGITLLVAGASARAARPSPTPRQRDAVGKTMVAGWVLGGVGAVAMAAGLLVRRTPPPPRAAAVRLAPTAGGAVLSGRF